MEEIKKKKKFKFNIIDAIVVLVIVAVVSFVGVNMFSPKDEAEDPLLMEEAEISTAKSAKPQTYIMSYFFEEVPDYAAEMIDKGSVVTDEANGQRLGRLLSVEIGDSVSYVANEKGEIVKSSKDGYKSVKLSLEIKAYPFAHGIEIKGVKYVVGHTMTVYAGKAKLYGRISAIEKK